MNNRYLFRDPDGENRYTAQDAEDGVMPTDAVPIDFDEDEFEREMEINAPPDDPTDDDHKG